jgi:hypothetical protein
MSGLLPAARSTRSELFNLHVSFCDSRIQLAKGPGFSPGPCLHGVFEVERSFPGSLAMSREDFLKCQELAERLRRSLSRVAVEDCINDAESFWLLCDMIARRAILLRDLSGKRPRS